MSSPVPAGVCLYLENSTFMFLAACRSVQARRATTTAAEEFLARARPVIHHAQGLNIPLGQSLTSIWLVWADQRAIDYMVFVKARVWSISISSGENASAGC